jgi:hypothetical protein
MHGCTCNREWRNRDVSAFLDLKASKTAKCPSLIQFDVAGFSASEDVVTQFASISINGAQQADGKGVGRPKSSASRDVGEADDFKWTQAMKLDGLPQDRMLDFAGVGNALLGGITDVVSS